MPSIHKCTMAQLLNSDVDPDPQNLVNADPDPGQ